jgi:hypothetical protein
MPTLHTTTLRKLYSQKDSFALVFRLRYQNVTESILKLVSWYASESSSATGSGRHQQSGRMEEKLEKGAVY